MASLKERVIYRVKDAARLIRKAWGASKPLRVELGRRLKNFLISIDQTFYSIITLGDANPDETLSSAAYRTEQKGRILGKFFRPIIDFLFLPFERDHCKKAYFNEPFRQYRHCGNREQD